MDFTLEDYRKYIDALNDIGIALSSEKDKEQLLGHILTSAMRLTHADGGTLYLLSDDQKSLRFVFFSNNTLKVNLQKVSEQSSTFKPIPLYDNNNNPNYKNIASSCVLQNQTKNIADAYHEENFDFSGTRQADKKFGYHSKSFLVVPLRNHENKIIGVLQLINSINPESGQVIDFTEDSVHLAESLASQAAIILTQQELIDAQKQLFEAFIQLIAKAIDEKSAYTSNHCSRVPIITMMLAEAAQDATDGPFKEFQLSKDQFEELRIAAWLHDCGKVSTPEYVMDKATKLSGIMDRLDVIDKEFEIIRRDLKIDLLEKRLNNHSLDTDSEAAYRTAINQLNDDQQFIHAVNRGGEFLSEKDKERIRNLAKQYHFISAEEGDCPLIDEMDTKNLCISKGTLNDEEREIIKKHVTVTLKMLESLPYPDYLKHVPEIAASHHERMDGKGYPKGLTGENMLIQARMVAIADIFEALTAADRPYKSAKTISETLAIMEDMKKNNHIDPDLFDLFIKTKIYLKYAQKYLKPEQIDVKK